MRELIAGDGGLVMVEAATSPDAVALACEGLAGETQTPSGLPVYRTDALPDSLDVDIVLITECEPATMQAVEAWAERRGIEWRWCDNTEWERPTGHRMPVPEGRRVVAVSSASTGSGKTALSRRVARTLTRSGVPVAVARHPIADLLSWGRFDPVVVRTPPELSVPRPLAEREELAPFVGAGIPVVTGLDPERVLQIAVREAGEGGVVVWDGGGAAPPWMECDLHLHAIDLLRPAVLRSADAYVLTKADSAPPGVADEVERFLRSREQDASAPIVLADLSVGVHPGNALTDRRVVIVEDANSLLLGGLAAGAGAVAARRFRCGVVDPRPFAIGAIAEALSSHPHIGAVIPSLGRTPQEIDDLAESVYATPGDAVLWASNADPAGVIGDEERPVIRAFGELTEVAGPSLQELLSPFLPGHS